MTNVVNFKTRPNKAKEHLISKIADNKSSWVAFEITEDEKYRIHICATEDGIDTVYLLGILELLKTDIVTGVFGEDFEE